MPIERGHVVQLARYRAVCVAVQGEAALVCPIVKPDEAWHRADMPLDWLDCLMSGLTTELRVRCWPHIIRGHELTVVGQLSPGCVDRVDGLIAREREMRAMEEKWRPVELN